MRVQIRNPVIVDANPTEDHTGVMLRFETASKHEAVVVIPNELVLGLGKRLLALAFKADATVAKDPERNSRNVVLEKL